MKYRGKPVFGILLGTSLLLSACGGGDGASSNGNGVTSLSGSAASGAAMTSGTVELSCKDGLKKTGIAISASGTWSTTVPTANLPCAVKASDGSQTYYSFTVGNGSSLVTNVTPLTTLTLAQILGASPASLFASLSATDLAKLNDTAINAAISALKAALASYALPGNFNPVTSPLTAAATGQSGNDYDRLLDQFKAANPDLDTLLTTAATGTMPTLATPSYTPGAGSFSEFFSTFAGTYTLTVASSGAEGANNTAVTTLFPMNSARTVHIQSNGDVSIDAVGRTLTYTAATYSAVGDRFDAGSVNTVRYRAGGTTTGNCCDLYIKYDSSTGKLEVDPAGFVSNEGYATLKGSIFATPPAPPAASCNSGDDKLVFTGGPTDFCGFTRSASGNNIAHYYQFTSSAGSHGVTYVKFETSSDDSSVLKVTVENDAYAFGCGGALAACSGVTLSGSSYKQFTLNNTALAVISGASQGITVNGLLIHPAGSGSSGGAGAGSQPITLSASGGSIGASDIAPLVGSYTGTLGDAYTPGSAGVTTADCTIAVQANGTVTVSANGKSLSAAFNGDAGDQIIHPTGNFVNALASDVAANTFAMVSVQSGYVSQATASHGDGGLNTTGSDRVDCIVRNPHVTTAGSAVTATIGGATAASLPATYAGTYSDGSCTVTLSSSGIVHLTSGSTDLTLTLGGDQQDSVQDFTSALGAVALTVADTDTDFQIVKVSLSRYVSDGHLSLGSALHGNTVLLSYPSCSNLARQ